MITPYYIEPSDREKLLLQQIVANAPDVDWRDPNLSVSFSNFANICMLNGMNRVRVSIENSYEINGFAVLRLTEAFNGYTAEQRKIAIAIIGFSVGQPFGAFNRVGFWQTLGVNHSAKVGRAHSIGYIPLHFDFDQSSNPPDGLVLYCERPDPTLGGENLIYDYRPFLNGLSPEEIEHLSTTTYSFASLYDANSIGEELNPHPFLTHTKQGRQFRYNGKASYGNNSPAATNLFNTLEPSFRANSFAVALEEGDMLFINQNAVLHGRNPLGNSVESSRPDPTKDRCLLQFYLRR